VLTELESEPLEGSFMIDTIGIAIIADASVLHKEDLIL